MSDSPLPRNRPIQEAALLSLITSQVREDRSIEFKSEYLPAGDSGKKRFLQSVAAFANARGGDLVMGLKEEGGVATGWAPLEGVDVDQCRLQILDLIRAHLEPRLGGVEVEGVLLAAGGHVLVVRVPKSWSGPHMLRYGDDRRFYIRTDGGNRPMDYEEVRDGFLGGEAIGARLRNFRSERCAAILSDETPRPLSAPARVVLHILPFEMWAMPRRFEVRTLFNRCGELRPIHEHSRYPTFDLDGCFTWTGRDPGAAFGYAYVFRSGAIEAVDALILAPRQNDPGKYIPHRSLEGKLLESVVRYLKLMQSLEVPAPMAIFLSLLNVRGYCMVPEPMYGDSGEFIARDHLFIPEVVMADLSAPIEPIMFTVFNSIWNACGLEQSRNFDADGNWRPGR